MATTLASTTLIEEPARAHTALPAFVQSDGMVRTAVSEDGVLTFREGLQPKAVEVFVDGLPVESNSAFHAAWRLESWSAGSTSPTALASNPVSSTSMSLIDAPRTGLDTSRVARVGFWLMHHRETPANPGDPT